jgi:hypothetical protein
MNYLDPSEFEAYGLQATTESTWVTIASSIMDSHCRRPTLGVNQYTERLRMQDPARAVRLTYLPLTALAPSTSAIVSARARYATPRRGEWTDEMVRDVALAFGIPGSWADLNVPDLDFCAETGEVTLPLNVMSWTFNEVEMTYTAGLDPIPGAVKAACAQIVKNAQATPALNLKKSVIDKMQFWYFADTLVDETVQAMLAPYVAQKVG